MREDFRTKKETIPRYLYKYFSNTKNALNVIEKGKIHLEAPSTYNDVFDGAITITKENMELLLIPDKVVDLIVRYTHRDHKDEIKAAICDNDFSCCKNMKEVVDVLISKGISSEIVDGMCNNLVHFYKNIKFSNNLISCFSETYSSELMWAHYGNHLEGVCLCFDTSLDPELFKHIQKIDYSMHRPVLSLGSFNMYFTKSLKWNYEQEWRIVIERELNDCFIETASCVGIILGAKLEFNSKIIKKVQTEIINGQSIDKIVEEEIPGWGALTASANQKQLSIYRAIPDPFEFKINIKEWGQDEIQI